MPLLRKRVFERVKPPSNLKDKDEVFYCELTGEVFEDYEEFFERMILCNSLVWSCERTGRHSLTFKEALDCEAKANEVLTSISEPLKCAILHAVHNMKTGKVGDLANDVYLFLKNTPLPGEDVEANINRNWKKCVVVTTNEKERSPKKATPSKTGNCKSPSKLKDEHLSGGFNINDLVSFQKDRKAVVTLCSVDVGGKSYVVSSKKIRRPPEQFSREKVKLFIRKSCVRSTINSDDGYWMVLDALVKQYKLGEPLIADAGKNRKRKSSIQSPGKATDCEKSPKKRKRSTSSSAGAKGKDGKKRRSSKSSKQETNGKNQQPATNKSSKASGAVTKKKLTIEQIQQLKEAERQHKLKIKEEEKEARKQIREKDREVYGKIKQLESDFLKCWSLPREDLLLEDSKKLPDVASVSSKISPEQFGDAMMVVEFLSAFGPLFNVKSDISYSLDFLTLENALFERNTEGPFYDILRFLLVTYLRVSKEENLHVEQQEEESSGSVTPSAADENDQPEDDEPINKSASINATAIAAWPLLSQGSELHELIVDQFSLTEVLRLHILSSGVRIGCGRFEWQKRGGFQYSDDPGVEFRHKEEYILRTLSKESVYSLPVGDKLKVLVLLCNQLLMLVTTREYIDEACDKVKELKKQLRELRHAERKRKRHLAIERYKKRVEERAQLKEAALKKLEAKKLLLMDKGKPTNSAIPSPVIEDAPSQQEMNGKDDSESFEAERIDKEKSKAFHDREIHLMKDLNKWLSVYSRPPLGHDRHCRPFWTFQSTNGIFVETSLSNSSHEQQLHQSASFDNTEIQNDDDTDNEESCVEDIKPSTTDDRLVFSQILTKRHDNDVVCKLLLQRYGCTTELNNDVILAKSKLMQGLVANISSSIEPIEELEDRKTTSWHVYHSSGDVTALIDGLNERGTRETRLKSLLTQQKDILANQIVKCEFFQPVPKVGTRSGLRSDGVDKTCFLSMDDFVEAALCEQLLDLEEKIWTGSLGVVKIDDRTAWRESMDENIAFLLAGRKSSDEREETTTTEESPALITNGNADEEPRDTPIGKFLSNHDDNKQRCSTPVIEDDPSNGQLVMVKRLADHLLQIERGIERRFLKPPLGDADEASRERACLERWEDSLKAVSNMSQIFIHLNTLDRSITWNKSILYTRCKLCRRKGDAEHMLLCDSCDRGFHMYCLKPPLAIVPEGDWYCKDCKPKEIIRTPVKAARKHRNEAASDDESASNSDSAVDSDEEYENDEEVEESEEETDDHGEICSVCGLDGTLVCCDMCPRVYHVSCTYPPMRKVPKGSWACQVCTDLDSDLPKSRRVVTAEKLRQEKERSGASSKRKQETSRSSRGKAKRPTRTSSPVAKRRKIDLVNVTKNSVADSTQLRKSRRFPGAFGRQERRQCAKLVEMLMNHDDAEPFVAPVDLDAVPDYLDVVINPMDLGTIKRKANAGDYDTLDGFLCDVRLVFENCTTYNSNRSAIGRAGTKLRKFFESKVNEMALD